MMLFLMSEGTFDGKCFAHVDFNTLLLLSIAKYSYKTLYTNSKLFNLFVCVVAI